MKYYEEHEVAYKNLKKGGYVGWGKKKTLEEMMDFSQRKELEQVLHSLEAPLNSRALDLGCGTGPISFFLNERGYKTWGVDISETAITEARKIGAELQLDAEFITADILQQDLPYGPFHIISDSSFFHCIVFDEERANCLNRIFHLLDEKGVFIVHTMISDRAVHFGSDFELDEQGVLWYLSKEPRTQDAVARSGGWATPQRRLLSSAQLRQELADAGFKERQVKYLYAEDQNNPLTLFGVYSR